MTVRSLSCKHNLLYNHTRIAEQCTIHSDFIVIDEEDRQEAYTRDPQKNLLSVIHYSNVEQHAGHVVVPRAGRDAILRRIEKAEKPNKFGVEGAGAVFDPVLWDKAAIYAYEVRKRFRLEEDEMKSETQGTWYQTFIQEESEDSSPTKSTEVEVIFAQSPDAVGRKMILKHAKLLQDCEDLSIVVLTGGGTGNYIIRV